MTLSITHSTLADGSFSATGATAWDATHSLTGVVDITQGGTGSTTATGSGSVVLQTSPLLITPTLSGAIVDNSAPYLDFANGSAVTLAAGRMWYDGVIGSWNLGMGGGNITQQVGEEIFVYGKASAAITEGQLICRTGVVGASGQITFAPSPTNLPDNDGIIGVATENISIGNFGRITYFGVIHGLDTTGTSVGETWVDGDTLWYNPSYVGGMTKVKPVAPNIKYQIATVIHAGNGGSGSLQINLQAGSQLGGTDSNVQLGTLANNDVLTYDSTLGYWKNAAPSGSSGVSSFNTRTGAVTLSSTDVTTALTYTPYNATNPSGYISGITSSNVTTALGYTPYNATNPSGYISGITGSDVTTALGYTPPNQTNPVLYSAVQFYGAGVTGYSPYANTMANWVVDTNNYSLFYLQNLNNGTDASADFVVYNDASDVDSYFIDMGINSSNYSSVTYPIFTPNSSYLFSGGGTGAITSDMFIGTSTANSDVVVFAGGVATTDEVLRIKANHNVIIGTDPDTGETFQVSGSAHIKGATEFSNTVLLSANPTTALQAATKQYVDNAASSGIHIHTAVYAETSAALSAVYVQGGTTFNITDITGGNTVVTSTVHGLAINDEIWLTTTAGNGLSINTAYFVYATPTTTSLQLSASYDGALLTGLTNATGLSYATRANSGVGSYLESSANATFTIGSYTLAVGNRILVYQQSTGYWNGVYTITSLGSGSTKWKLTRAADQNKYSPQDTSGIGAGDYFLVTTNSESYVLTTVGELILGYTGLTYTLFSSAPVYTGGTNINIAGGVISVAGTIAATLGGTGTSTVTTGDLLYGSGTDTWGKLPAGAAYKSLVMNAGGTQVEWNAIALNQANAVAGQLGIGNGGTGASTAAAALTALGAYPATNPNGYTNNTGTVTSVAALTLGTTGTDLGSTVATGTTTPVITLNVPTASATNRGALSSTDWSTFNGKQAALGYTPVNKAGDTMTGTLNLAAGTTLIAPLDIPTATSLMTTAAAGAVEFDGIAPYFSVANSTRGAIATEQWVVLTGTNTLTSQTAVQPIFDGGGGPTNGAVTLPVGTYQFECSFALTGMSATSGSFGFGLAGAATKTFSYQATSSKTGTALATAMVTNQVFGTAANTALQTATVGTVGTALIKGIIRVTVAGTVIPQVSLTIASAAIVQAGSYFRVSPIGNATVATLGNWS